MDPKNPLMLQKSIKDNASNLQEYMKDISSWEKEMKAKDQALNQISSEDNQQSFPPVRSKKTVSSTAGPETTKQISVKSSSDNKRKTQTDKPENKPKKISGSDYAAWDKFDVDKALKSSDEEGTDEDENEESKKVVEGYNKQLEENKKYKESVISGAVELKDEGNKLYAGGKLKEALAKYTQGMELDPTNAILPANRAMAYIKLQKYTAAEADCDCCLSIDPKYIKGYLRRATSRINLGKSEDAAKDYKKVLELEPWNKDAKRELEKITSVLQKNKSNDQSSEKITKNKEHVSKENLTPAKPIEKKKKLKIIEVDSGKESLNLKENTAKDDPNMVSPVDKPPHLRSKKPLKKVKVVDVPSKGEIKNISTKTTEDIVISPTSNSKVSSTTISKKDLQLKRANEAEELRHRMSNSNKSSSETKPSQPSEAPKTLTLPAVPRNSHQFSQDWSRISKNKDLASKYIQNIKPEFFHKVELEADILVDMASLIHSESFTAAQAAKYLDSFTRSQGFSLNIMFLTQEQKQVFSEIMKKCASQENFDKTAKRLKEAL